MRFFGLMDRGLASLTLVLFAGACSDDGVGPQQSMDTGATAPTSDADDDDGSGANDGAATGGAGTSADTGGDTMGPAPDTGDGTDGGPLVAECRADEECAVFNDCCMCSAAPVDFMPPACEKACLQSTCDALGLIEPTAQCRFGMCTIAKKSCNAALVECDAPPPECPDGSLPELENGCWSGACILLQQCDVVPDCAACRRNETCVVTETQLGPWYACEPIAPACDGIPSCDCMSEACTGAYDTCVDDREGGLSCTCPEC